MARASRIEWTETTWNPVTGCTKVSAGCANCYAEPMALRLQSMGIPEYSRGFDVTVHPSRLESPLRWRHPRTVFVNSMGDLFHNDVPVDFIDQVFDVMRRAAHHTFQVLTKRSSRLEELDRRIDWPNNVWLGVSVESPAVLDRVGFLRKTGARVKFLSVEPLLSALPTLDVSGIDWVIVGGESGPHSRPMSEEWVLEILEKCQAARVPFFFKQWGGVRKKAAGRLLGGRLWDETPRTALHAGR